MNVLFLNSIEKGTYGGMEEWIKLTASSLAARGHEVTVAGRPGSAFLNRISCDENGVRILPIDMHGDFSPITIARLRQYISGSKIDVVLVNFNKDVRLGGLAAALAGNVKVVWSVGLDITSKKLVHRYLTPRLVDSLLVPSEALKGQIIGKGYINENIVEVIPIGIPDLSNNMSREEAAPQLRERYGLPVDCLVAVTVGRFVDQKGHMYLVEAARDIVQEVPSIRFLWLGDGPLFHALEQKITDYGLQDHFVFAGMLSQFDIELLGADLMIHPSVEEPFGIALVEGMRAGLPVVASRVGGIPEVVSEGATAVLMPPANPGELARTVCDLVQSPEQFRTMREKSRERWRATFQVNTMIDRVESHMTRLISKKEPVHG